MQTGLLCLWMTCVAAAAPVEIKFAQVSPAFHEVKESQRSAEENCAVVLVQGLSLHPFSNSGVEKAAWQSWQQPQSTLVKELGKESDVFALAYSQNVSVEEVAGSDTLAINVAELKQLG